MTIQLAPRVREEREALLLGLGSVMDLTGKTANAATQRWGIEPVDNTTSTAVADLRRLPEHLHRYWLPILCERLSDEHAGQLARKTRLLSVLKFGQYFGFALWITLLMSYCVLVILGFTVIATVLASIALVLFFGISVWGIEYTRKCEGYQARISTEGGDS